MLFVMGGYLSVCVAEFHIWVTEIHARTRSSEANTTEHVSPLRFSRLLERTLWTYRPWTWNSNQFY